MLKMSLPKFRTSKPSEKQFEDGLLFDAEDAARSYLETHGVLSLLAAGSDEEIHAVLRDLAFLHRAVRRKRPKIVLEFGVGFSTIVIAHALRHGQKGAPLDGPKLFAVDTSPEWIANLQKKVPEDLAPFIDITHSDAEVLEVNGQLCHAFRHLPNVRPDFIYLDGPDPRAVRGEIRGLAFTMRDGSTRPPVSADMLFYESTLRRGSIIAVDGRFNNVWFLKNNLKRRWRSNVHDQNSVAILELME